MKFHIICTCRNAEKWIEKCIGSVLSQRNQNYSFHLLIDQPTDKTHQIANRLVGEHEKFHISITHERKYAAAARWQLLSNLSVLKKDIIVLLDGDDWLNGTDVLNTLASVYTEKKCLATHGNYKTSDGKLCQWSGDYSQEVKSKNYFRSTPWIATHLRTFKYGLFQYLKSEIHLDANGNPIKAATDFALFLPILELCGLYSTYIPSPLYVYNEREGEAMQTDRILEQLRVEKEIRERPPYCPLSIEKIKELI
jgi:glycosyltransferase involved in cell wall biosynthesis